MDLEFYNTKYNNCHIVVARNSGIEKTQFPVNPLTFIDNINESDKNMGIDKFVVSGKNTNTIAQSMSKIQKGQAISNIKEFDKAKLFEVNQYWERK